MAPPLRAAMMGPAAIKGPKPGMATGTDTRQQPNRAVDDTSCAGADGRKRSDPPDFLYASKRAGRYNPAGVECVYWSEKETTARRTESEIAGSAADGLQPRSNLP